MMFVRDDTSVFLIQWWDDNTTWWRGDVISSVVVGSGSGNDVIVGVDGGNRGTMQ